MHAADLRTGEVAASEKLDAPPNGLAVALG
jgi:hypothetical protein